MSTMLVNVRRHVDAVSGARIVRIVGLMIALRPQDEESSARMLISQRAVQVVQVVQVKTYIPLHS